jgi:hypothetical protein
LASREKSGGILKQILTSESDNLAACYLFILERMRARRRKEQEAQQSNLQVETNGIDLQPIHSQRQEQTAAITINSVSDYAGVEHVQSAA